jgi:hypothetical protein
LEELKDLIRSQILVTSELVSRETQMMEHQSNMLNDHEKRIRIMERTLAYGAGAIGLGLYLFKLLGH